jgi:Tfp pilus assembly protein PilX
MLIGAIRIETVLVVMVVLNLIGLSIAAYLVMRRK